MKSYKLRIMIIIFILSLLTQSIYYVSWYVDTTKLNLEIVNNTNSKQINYLYKNTITAFNEVDTLLNTLNDKSIRSYVYHYLNLKSKEEAFKETQQVNTAINSLDISPLLIKNIMLISSNKNQKNFIKEVGKEQWNNEEFPRLDELRMAGLTEVILGGGNLAFYVEHGELQKALKKKNAALSKESYESIQRFINCVEGNIILCQYGVSTATNSVVIIVIRPDFLKQYITSDENYGRYITIVDSKQRMMWTNDPGKFNLLPKDNVLFKYNTKGKVDSIIKGNKYIYTFNTVEPQGFKIIVGIPKDTFFWQHKGVILGNLCLSIFICIISAIAAFTLISMVIGPFNNISDTLKGQFEASYEKLILGKYSSKIFKNKPLNKKIFNIFTICIIIPSLLAGVYYSLYLYSSSKIELEDYMKDTSHQISLNVDNLIKSSYRMNQFIPVNIIKDYAYNYNMHLQVNQKAMEDLIFSRSSANNIFSYFVLLDTSGNSIYQSIYSQNQQLFNIPSEMFKKFYLQQKSDIFMVSDIKDIFNQPTVALVKKIKIKDLSGIDEETIGYFEMFLNQNSFQSIRSDYQLDFSVLDREGNIIYSTDNSSELIQESKEINIKDLKYENNIIIRKIDGLSNIVASEMLEDLGWSVFVYQKLDNIIYRSESFLFENLILSIIIFTFIMIISWYLSRRLVRPIELIKNDMHEIGDGKFESNIEYHGYDEIEELVHAYNEMVERVNKLIEENTNQKIKEQELLMLKTQAELNMLQQQINPHFLYNTLELISSSSEENGNNISGKMARALSRIFRYATNTTDKLVSLQEEIDHAMNYISIQQMRFPDKFQLHMDIDSCVTSFKVIKFILQPIIENSINHGLYSYTSGGLISISIKKQEGFMIIEISDNGVGMKKDELKNLIDKMMDNNVAEEVSNMDGIKSKGSGIGIRNVYKRLMIYYKGVVSMEVDSKFMRGTNVKIMIPVE